jgi:type I restriction enzyme S subunit
MTALQGKTISMTKESITEAGLNNSGARLLPKGTVVVTTRASIGMVGVTGCPLTTNQGFKSLIPNRDADPDFLCHLFSQVTHELYRRASGTTFQEISGSEFGEIRVPSPSVDEQARIAEVLDTLDEAIREAQAVIFKQGAVYQGLQEQFFTPGAVRDREGWQEMQLEDIAESITSGPRGWATYYADEGDYFLRIGNLTRKHLDLRFDDVVKVKPPIGAEGVRTALAPGDLLISITADLGIIGVVPDWMGVAYINQHIARARLDRNKVNPRFLGYQLSGLIGQKQFYRLNDVGAKAGLNLPAVGGLKVWLPPLAEQDRIAGTLDGLQQALQQEEAVHSNLKSLKSGLSSDLLTGRVRTRPH